MLPLLLHVPPWVSAATITTLALLTFVPTPYLYATRGGPHAGLINAGARLILVSEASRVVLSCALHTTETPGIRCTSREGSCHAC